MALMAAIAKQGRRIVFSSSRLKRSCCVSADKSTDEAKSDAKDEETGWIEVYPSKSAPVATLKDIANKDNRYIPMFARQVTEEEMVESSEIPKGYSLILQVRGSSSDPLAIFYASAIQVLRDRLSRRMQILVLQFARVYKLTVSEVLSNLGKNNALHMAAVTPLTEQEALDQFTYEMNAIVTETLDTKKDQQAGRLVHSLLATRNLAESNVLSTLPDLIDVHWVRQLGLYGDASVLLEDALHETDENGEIHPTLASRLSPVELRSKIRAFQRSDLYTQRVKTAHPLERLLNQSILLDLMRFWTIEPQVNIEQGRKTSGHLPSGSFIRLDPPVRGPFLDEMRRNMSVPQPFLNNPPAEVIAREVQDLVLITTNFIDRIVSRFRKEIDQRAIRNKKKASRSRAVWYTAQSGGGAGGTRFRKFNPWPNRNWSTSTRMCSVASYCSSANSKRPELVLEQIGCPELTLAKAQIFPLQITIKAMATSFLACGFSTGLSSFLPENDHSVRRSNAGLTMILICSQVKLVVIDSVTFHFRQDFQDLALRTRLLNSMAQKLMALSHQYDLAVWSCFDSYLECLDSNGDEEIHENIEDDQIVFPGEAIFEKVQQANGRVFILKFLIDDRKFFWIQEPNPASDPVFVRVVNAHINGEHPKADVERDLIRSISSSRKASRSTSFSANDATPIQGEAGGSGGGGGGPGGAAVENPRNPPPVQLAELQQILANLGQSLGGSSQAFRDPGPSLVEVLKPENVIPLLENSSHWQERLAPYLPEALRSGKMDLQQFGIDPTQCDFTVVSFLEAIQTQAMESVLTALRSGEMDLQQFGIDPTQCDFTVVSFLEAIQKQAMESVSSNLPDVPDIDENDMDE